MQHSSPFWVAHSSPVLACMGQFASQCLADSAMSVAALTVESMLCSTAMALLLWRFRLWLFRGLDQRIVMVCRPADHIVQRLAGSYHGIHGVFFFHVEVDEERPIVVPRHFHRGQHLRPAIDRGSLNPMRPRQLHKVGRKDL